MVRGKQGRPQGSFGYWRGRAEAAEAKVERQNKFMTDQVIHIDRLTNELRELRKAMGVVQMVGPEVEIPDKHIPPARA